MVPAAAWLLVLLVVLEPPWAAAEVSQEIESGSSAKYGQCFQFSLGEARALNLGQRWGDPSPTATMYIDLQAVTSAASSFDFRTFDPEGVIFYGDIQPDVDWFILALRKGKTEMQIHNAITKITVSGGQRLNDGQWHRILVKNEGHAVVLEVDGEEHLTLNHVSHSIVSQTIPSLRIGVGGLLIPVQELLVPLNTAMDGCMRRWNWLNRSAEWQEASSLEDKGTKRCFSTIRRGSFFPGDGLATFSLSDLPTGLSPANGSWSLTVDLWVGAVLQSATLLAVATASQKPVLRLDLQGTDLVLQMGNKTVLPAPLSAGDCLDSHLLLHITSSHLAVHLGDAEASVPVPKPEFEILRQVWLDRKGSLVIGGLPGQELSVQAEDRTFFHGCLRSILVQGRELDLDAVQSRSSSIWAHSCPGGDTGTTGMGSGH